MEYRFGPGEELPYEFNESLYQTTFGTSGWCHLICEEDGLEGRELEICLANRKPYTRPVHACCHPDSAWKEQTLDLRALRTCRHLYAEANKVLWTTNTFSFQLPMSLELFLKHRNASQKSIMYNLRLHIHSMAGTAAEWRRALNNTMVQSLKGLKHLRIYIEMGAGQRELELYQGAQFECAIRICDS